MSDEQTITLVRTIAAPVAKVFTAWIDPALMAQWLAPTFCKVTEVEADPRPGGTYRFVVVSPFGKRVVTSGEYREVVPNQRLVKTWVFQGESPAVDRYPTLLTVTFRELDPSSTEITIRQDQLKTPADRAGNRMGWRLCLHKLAKLLRRST